MPAIRRLCLVLPLLALAACGKSEPEKAPVPEKAASETKAVQPTQGKAVDNAAGTKTGSAQAEAPPQNLPTRPGRSPAPTLDEWNAQQKEVTVKGSSALKCETKIVREYLRITCRGKNDTGGTPTGVVIRKGGHGEAFAFVGAGVTSLVVPFAEGTDFAADFSWTDKSHTLTVAWPRGSAKPVIVGAFEGAKSPLDTKSDEALAAKLCECHKKVRAQTTCDDLIGGPNGDCDRTYGNNCELLLECSRGEPGAFPKCLPGYRNAFTGFCYKECGAGKPACGAGETCEDAGYAQVCVGG